MSAYWINIKIHHFLQLKKYFEIQVLRKTEKRIKMNHTLYHLEGKLCRISVRKKGFGRTCIHLQLDAIRSYKIESGCNQLSCRKRLTSKTLMQGNTCCSRSYIFLPPFYLNPSNTTKIARTLQTEPSMLPWRSQTGTVTSPRQPYPEPPKASAPSISIY